MNKERILNQLKIDEGFKPTPYWDRTQWTYGYGCKAPNKNARISEPDAAKLLSKRLDQSISEYNSIFKNCKVNIDETRECAIVNMIFNLGKAGFLEFKTTLRNMFNGKWIDAANSARKSLWYKQIGKRSVRICKEIEQGDSLYKKE